MEKEAEEASKIKELTEEEAKKLEEEISNKKIETNGKVDDTSETPKTEEKV